MAWFALALALSMLSALGCKREEVETEPSPQEPSPNASILPSPLASTRPLPLVDAGPEADAGDATPDVEAGSTEPLVPTPWQSGHPPRPETVLTGETAGAVLDARFTWHPRSPGPARGQGDFPVRIELAAQGRLRMLILSEHMPLAKGSVLLAQAEHYGHLLLYGESNYRILELGTLRALFEELRADVSPLQEAKTKRQAGGKLLGLPVQVDTIRTAMGTLVLEQAEVGGLGGSGALVCRLLSELVLAKPDNRACRAGWLPLKAEYGWAEAGRFGFTVSTFARRQDLKSEDFLIPPADSDYRLRQLPEAPGEPWATPEELQRIEPGAKVKPNEETGKGAEARRPRREEPGLLVKNTYEVPRYLMINGDTVAWLKPGHSLHFKELRAGSYTLSARDFLGLEEDQRVVVNVPGRQTFGPTSQAEAKAP